MNKHVKSIIGICGLVTCLGAFAVLMPESKCGSPILDRTFLTVDQDGTIVTNQEYHVVGPDGVIHRSRATTRRFRASDMGLRSADWRIQTDGRDALAYLDSISQNWTNSEYRVKLEEGRCEAIEIAVRVIREKGGGEAEPELAKRLQPLLAHRFEEESELSKNRKAAQLAIERALIKAPVRKCEGSVDL